MLPSKPETRLTVCLSPADFDVLANQDLGSTTCVVFDVLRATSSMLTALSHGAEAILPVETIEEALALRRAAPSVLLGGERHGSRIGAELTGGVEFDLGNSPREYTAERVAGRRIAMTTTNGTRALRACARAESVLVGALLNVQAVVALLARRLPARLTMVCSGTFAEASLEDTLACGAVCHALWTRYSEGHVSDSAAIARQVYLSAEADFEAVFARALNARRLLARPELSGDVAFCQRRDALDFAAALGADGWVRRLQD